MVNDTRNIIIEVILFLVCGKSRLNAIQNDFWLNYAEVWSKPVVYAIIHIGLQSDEAGGKKQWNSIIP